MKFLFFAGCKIPNYLKHYETSSRAILRVLGVELVDLELNCCGYPIRHQNLVASVFSSARNIALAGKYNLDILTPCKCCFGNMKHAVHWLREDSELRNKINTLLIEEGLHYEEGVQVKHLLSVLFHDVGIETIKASIKHPYKGLKIAPHYGCHALRPSQVVNFDNPLAPTLFEKLVEATGAESVFWPRRLECCGNPLWEKNSSLSLYMMQKKLGDAMEAGADFLCTACTYCQIQFDQVRSDALQDKESLWRDKLPSILYPQLLGLSLGLDESVLGINNNAIDSGHLTRYCQ